jgi:cytochrome c-type biogenesis protein CcmF
VTEGQGANFQFQRAHLTVTRDGKPVTVLEPERRFYPVQRQGTSETAIRTNLFGDLYSAMGDPDGTGAYVLRLYYHPLVPWIWGGALIMALGGMVSLSDRRFRVGAPVRRAVPAAALAKAGA